MYEAQVTFNGVLKSGNGGVSTFFPDNWTKDQEVNAINEAYSNRIFQAGSINTYIGQSKADMSIGMYLDNANKIISAFPIKLGGIKLKYDYELKALELPNGEKFLTIILPEGMNTITEFLTSDVQDQWYGQIVIDLIDKVMNGNSALEEIRGNACKLFIKNDSTKVINYLFESIKVEGINFESEIETAELKELIEIWIKEKARFKEEN